MSANACDLREMESPQMPEQGLGDCSLEQSEWVKLYNEKLGI